MNLSNEIVNLSSLSLCAPKHTLKSYFMNIIFFPDSTSWNWRSTPDATTTTLPPSRARPWTGPMNWDVIAAIKRSRRRSSSPTGTSWPFSSRPITVSAQEGKNLSLLKLLMVWLYNVNHVFKTSNTKLRLCGFKSAKGSSMNDVTVLGGGGIKDFVTTVLKP